MEHWSGLLFVMLYYEIEHKYINNISINSQTRH